MGKTPVGRSARIRSRLKHPVVDADGHILELTPFYLDYLRDVGGSDMPKRFLALGNGPGGSAWWTEPGRNSLDRATASLPKLLYRRMDELGFDYCVLYPTLGNEMPQIADPELRIAACRAYNTYNADRFREFSDRLTPAAVLPMQTPAEAIAELEHSVKVLKLKVAVFHRVVRRDARPHRLKPSVMLPPNRFDCFGLDSDFDHDPVWAKFVELKIAPTSHSTSGGFGTRQSPTNYVYNKIGHFAAASEAVCKSLFMGGVTRRFPTIRIALLEAGVGWACDLYAEMVNVWRKRNPVAAKKNLDPALLDRKLIAKLFSEYGNDRERSRLDEVKRFYDVPEPMHRLRLALPPPGLDDWAFADIKREEDLRDLFAPYFFFGCEGDSPLTPWAFNKRVNPVGARLRPIFGSDIGHWDVSDMNEVLEETYEPVEKGLMTEAEFKEFVFLNPLRLYAGMNPDFFNGTKIESEAKRALQRLKP